MSEQTLPQRVATIRKLTGCTDEEASNAVERLLVCADGITLWDYDNHKNFEALGAYMGKKKKTRAA